MACWLLKSEPDRYGWDDLVREGRTEWTGVRNHAAAAYLRAMALGDHALFYHSGAARAAVGVCKVTRTARPDGDDGTWVSVEIAPVAPLAHPVTLAAMKAEPALAAMPTLRQSRLSVAPVGDAEWDVLTAMGKAKA